MSESAVCTSPRPHAIALPNYSLLTVTGTSLGGMLRHSGVAEYGSDAHDQEVEWTNSARTPRSNLGLPGYAARRLRPSAPHALATDATLEEALQQKLTSMPATKESADAALVRLTTNALAARFTDLFKAFKQVRT